MEVTNYATKGVAGTGLGLGIAGTALGLLNGGAGLLGATNTMCSEDHYVNRFELEMQSRLAEKDSEIAGLKTQDIVDQKIVNLANSVQGKFNEIDAELRNIAVYQATNTAGIGCLTNQVNAIQMAFNGLTKTVIPSENVCPQPMPALNSWTAPTAPTTGS